MVLTASVGLGTTLYPKSVLYWFSVVVVVAVYETFGVFFTGGEGEGDSDEAALNESLLKWFEY